MKTLQLPTIVVGSIKAGDAGEYIGRAGHGRVGSPLGNPFVVGKDGPRGTCVDLFEPWLEAKMRERDRAVCDELLRLANLAISRGSLTLVCWCRGAHDDRSSARCHGDVIRKFVLLICIAHARREEGR